MFAIGSRRRRLVSAAGLTAIVGLMLAVAVLIVANRLSAPRGLAGVQSAPGRQANCSGTLSPSGTKLAVAGCDGSISLWDIATRKRIATLASPGCPTAGPVVFSPDGKTLAQFGEHLVPLNVREHHPTFCLWDMAARRVTVLTDPGPPLQMFGFTQGAFSPGGGTLAVADDSANIYLWNLAARRVIAIVPASKNCATICPIAFSPDGTTLAVGGSDPSGDRGRVYLWDLAARRWTGTLTDPGTGTLTDSNNGIDSLAFGRNGILAVSTGVHAYLWDVAARRLTGTITPPIDVARGNASILKDGEPYPVAGAFVHSITAVFSPDGTTLAVDASFGYGTYLYNVATRKRVATLTIPGGQYSAGWMVFSPDGTTLAVAESGPSRDSAVYLWNVMRKTLDP